MLHVILKFDQNLISFLLQNWSKFDEKSIKKWYRIQGWFWNRYFFNFWSFLDKFWTNFGSKMGGVLLLKILPIALPPPGGVQRQFKNFGPISNQSRVYTKLSPYLDCAYVANQRSSYLILLTDTMEKTGALPMFVQTCSRLRLHVCTWA